MTGPALLSDIGNVLVSFDFDLAAERCSQFSPLSPAGMFSRLDGIKQPYESGRIGDDVFVSQAMAALQFSGTRAQFIRIWCEIFSENAPMERTLAGLSGSMPMFLLSNTNGLHKDHLFQTFSVFQHFQDGLYSYSAGCAKPERRIFEEAVVTFQLDPARTLYVDDLEPNLQTAQEIGFHTHLYRLDDHGAFEKALSEWKAGQGL